MTTCFTTTTKECYVITKAYRGKPQKIELDIADPMDIYCSYLSNAFIVSRVSGGAIAIGSSPFGNLGLCYERSTKNQYEPEKLLKNNILKNAWLGKYLTVIKTEPAYITPPTNDYFEANRLPAGDLDIITVVTRRNQKRKREDEDRNPSPRKISRH